MTDRADRAGLALAAAGHLVLLGLLSVAWSRQQPRHWPEPTPIEVSLVDTVTPEAQAPPAPTPPAPSIAPEQGAPEEAAPPPAPAPQAQPQARPEPAQPKPEPAKPAPAAPARPAPAPRPAPQARPQPPTPAERPVPARPAAAAPARPERLAGIAAGLAAGTQPAATAARPRGHRLGDNFLAGLAPDAPSRTASPAAPASRAGPYPTASIVGAIARQIQPCADRQVNPGPGANRIVTTLNIRLNPDGTLAATPTKVRQTGVTDENERYAQRVVDLGIAAFKGCSPLRLPSEYYRTEGGGWNNINYQWQLR